MSAQRWSIARKLFVVLLLGAGVALAARRKGAEPPPEPAPPAATATPAAPPMPSAPALFADGLPVPAQQVPDGLPSLSAQGCNGCHGAVHDAWKDGPHARAWNAPAFRAALDRTGDTTACTGCHLPLQNQHPRLAAGYVEGDLARPDMRENPTWDPTLMSEGVTCAACHVRDGVVATARAGGAAPHPLAHSDELASGAVCATCHQLTWPDADQPFYDTWGEWERSPYAAAGVGCVDCHMPPVAGAATATRFAAQSSHAFPADTARALSVLVRTGAPEVQRGEPFAVSLRLQNTGAGHSVPTGSPFKAYRVVARIVGEDGKVVSEPFTHDLARTVEDAPPWATLSDTRLPPGGEVALDATFEVSQRQRAGRGAIEVGVYRLDAAERASSRWTPESEDAPLVVHRIPIQIL
ncbi:MAG: hypothetical protein H6742_11055 [Alphaproteobacteria bacterium]|nr:hypothetical protein [Alphaproteobacteria bacterium]